MFEIAEPPKPKGEHHGSVLGDRLMDPLNDTLMDPPSMAGVRVRKGGA